MFPNTNFTHQPVLAARCIELLGQGIEQAGQQGRALVIDGTLGLGGHSELILQTYPQVHLIGIDRDKQALASASRRLREYSSRFTAVHATYDAIGQVAAAYEDDAYPLGGILMDLGVSSLQLDDVARGFSYARDANLDMRMDQSGGKTAADLLAELSDVELAKNFARGRRRKVCCPDCSGNSKGTRRNSTYFLGAVSGNRARGHPRSGASHRGESGQENLPGTTDSSK